MIEKRIGIREYWSNGVIVPPFQLVFGGYPSFHYSNTPIIQYFTIPIFHYSNIPIVCSLG
jgi:hypothetical protein